jgi:hypothetical protein
MLFRQRTPTRHHTADAAHSFVLGSTSICSPKHLQQVSNNMSLNILFTHLRQHAYTVPYWTAAIVVQCGVQGHTSNHCACILPAPLREKLKERFYLSFHKIKCDSSTSNSMAFKSCPCAAANQPFCIAVVLCYPRANSC